MTLARLTVVSLFATVLVALFLYPNLRSLSYLKSAIKYGLCGFTVFRKRFSSHDHVGPIFGLKISLILSSFYAAQGLANALNRRPRRSQNKPSNSLILPKIPFHFMEIPVLLSLIVFGSVVLPVSVVRRYLTVLAGFAPVMPLLEVASLLTVVMAAGRSWTPKIVESHDFVKVSVVLACFLSFALSSSAIYFIYANFRLSTLISSLISSLFTLMVVQIISCCRVDHATITDPALIFPYVSYNLLLIALKSGIRALLDHQRDPPIYPNNPQKFLKIVEFLFVSATPGKLPSLTRQILQTFFSPILIFHLLLQLALITAASSEPEGRDSEDPEQSILFSARKFFVSNLWPLFGKSFLVIIYTISWLEQCHPETLISTPLLDSCGLWRWIAIGCSVAWYGKHLLFDGSSCTNNSDTKSTYTCDKSFWRQFHNLKDE